MWFCCPMYPALGSVLQYEGWSQSGFISFLEHSLIMIVSRLPLVAVTLTFRNVYFPAFARFLLPRTPENGGSGLYGGALAHMTSDNSAGVRQAWELP
jgi:hypothetical protein